MSVVLQAIEAAGGTVELAKAIGCDRTTVLDWKRKGEIPVHRVAAVERATGIKRERLRPDIFERAPAQTGAA